MASVRERILSAGYEIEEEKEIPYGVQIRVRIPSGTSSVRIYQNKKGEITLDTSQIKDDGLLSAVSCEATDKSALFAPPPLIGSDEAGKGDWFGPLVAAAVYTDGKAYAELAKMGVKDSKALSDRKIEKLKDDIISVCRFYSVIEVAPSVFNHMYSLSPNMNVILVKAHSHAVRGVLRRTDCSRILVDQFTTEDRMRNELADIPGLEILQRHRAEENMAVAAASILARYTYMKRLSELSEKYGIDFPAGAGDAADAAAALFAEKYGKDALRDVCKINFKNTDKVH